MPADPYAGYTLTETISTEAGITHWRARGPDGVADVFIGPPALLERVRILPDWPPFSARRVGVDTNGDAYVVVPGALEESLTDLAWRLGPGPGTAFLWHVAAALAELHDRAGAHGALHPDFIGVDTDGFLAIRPALAVSLPQEPALDASAQDTDCFLFSALVDTIANSNTPDVGLCILRDGLATPRPRTRIAPGCAIRQTITALVARKPDWEDALVEELGKGWSLEQDYNAIAPRPRTPGPVRPTASPEPDATQRSVEATEEPKDLPTILEEEPPLIDTLEQNDALDRQLEEEAEALYAELTEESEELQQPPTTEDNTALADGLLAISHQRWTEPAGTVAELTAVFEDARPHTAAAPDPALQKEAEAAEASPEGDKSSETPQENGFEVPTAGRPFQNTEHVHKPEAPADDAYRAPDTEQASQLDEADTPEEITALADVVAPTDAAAPPEFTAPDAITTPEAVVTPAEASLPDENDVAVPEALSSPADMVAPEDIVVLEDGSAAQAADASEAVVAPADMAAPEDIVVSEDGSAAQAAAASEVVTTPDAVAGPEEIIVSEEEDVAPVEASPSDVAAALEALSAPADVVAPADASAPQDVVAPAEASPPGEDDVAVPEALSSPADMAAPEDPEDIVVLEDGSAAQAADASEAVTTPDAAAGPEEIIVSEEEGVAPVEAPPSDAAAALEALSTPADVVAPADASPPGEDDVVVSEAPSASDGVADPAAHEHSCSEGGLASHDSGEVVAASLVEAPAEAPAADSIPSLDSAEGGVEASSSWDNVGAEERSAPASGSEDEAALSGALEHAEALSEIEKPASMPPREAEQGEPETDDVPALVIVDEVEQTWLDASLLMPVAETESLAPISILDEAAIGDVDNAPVVEPELGTESEPVVAPGPVVGPEPAAAADENALDASQRLRRPLEVVAPEVVRPTRMRPPRGGLPEVAEAASSAEEVVPVAASVQTVDAADDMLVKRKTGSEPLWDGIKGVTNTPNREKELGLGKWTAQGRSPEEIRRALPGSPPRELDLSVERPTWPLVTALVLLLMAGLGWLWQVGFSQGGDDIVGETTLVEDPTPEEP